MQFEEVKSLIIHHLGEDTITDANEKVMQPCLSIRVEKIAEVGQLLHENGFDHLACITGIDNGAAEATMEVLYHLYSIPKATSLTLKVKVPRHQPEKPLPSVPTLSHIWRTADWHEREAYDLLGIHFEGHLDLRRILLPADWQGFPLRKDYEQQEIYHGISVK
jgi:NADH-quinone oxidoreductase subunit C